MLRTQARFPDVSAGKGHYESFYLKACHPSEPLGIWIRYTVHKHSGQEPQGSIWFTLFDGAGDGPRASKVTTPEVSAPADTYIRIGESTFEDGRVAGTAKTEQLDASWELSFGSDEEPLFHLARDWMYRAPVPRTKLLTPYPGARFDGTVRAGEREVALQGWRGMVGHNWGTQHAERWIWLHGDRLRRRRGRLARRGDRPDQARPRHHAVDRERDALPGRRAPSHRRAGEGALDAGHREPDAVRLPAPGRRPDRERAGRVRPQELRRLGLRGPGRPRAQHGQLLDRRHDAHGHRRRPAGPRAPRCAAAPPTSSGCARPTTASRCSPSPMVSSASVRARVLKF